MRNMGGLRKKMPTTFWVYLIGALALAGITLAVGLFGVGNTMMRSVNERTKDIGVRLALGAQDLLLPVRLSGQYLGPLVPFRHIDG